MSSTPILRKTATAQEWSHPAMPFNHGLAAFGAFP